MTLKRTRHLDIYITIKGLIEEHPDCSVNRLCKFGLISRASYYKWKTRVDNENDVLNKRIEEKVEQIHDEHPDMGYRRIRDTLEHDCDIKVNDKRVLRICRKKKIRSIIKHRYNCCTKPASDPAYVAENILNREFHANKLNEKWVTDVSEFKYGTGEDERKGKIYLSVILDLCDRRPVAYVYGDHKQAELLEAGNEQSLIEEIGDAIINLREERQSILTEATLKHDLQERMEDLIAFLDEQTEAVTEYSEPLARRLIEKITVYDEKLVVEFKSGFTVEVEA